jgi:hypothetical protein
LLAGSVPELMLSYVVRMDTPSDPALRQRAGMVIDGPMVQKALKVLALASHRQESPEGRRPLFQPLVFPTWLAMRALEADEGMALEQADQRKALLGYLIELNLLCHPGADAEELRFPLDPLEAGSFPPGLSWGERWRPMAGEPGAVDIDQKQS